MLLAVRVLVEEGVAVVKAEEVERTEGAKPSLKEGSAVELGVLA